MAGGGGWCQSRLTLLLPPASILGPGLSHRAPLCGEPLRLALAHLTLPHHRRLVQVCTLAGLNGGEIAPCLLDANDVATLRSVPTWNIALHITKHEKNPYI